jgi:hypothetical protein
VKAIITTLAAICATGIAGGCASSARPDAPPVPPVAPQTASVAPTNAPAVSGADAAHKDLEKNAHTMGYKPRKTKDGEVRWCKTEAQIGTHFETTNCISEDMLAQRVEEMLKSQDLMRSMAGQCNGSNCTSH